MLAVKMQPVLQNSVGNDPLASSAPLLPRGLCSLPLLPLPVHLLINCLLSQSLNSPSFFLSLVLVSPRVLLFGSLNVSITFCTATQRHVFPLLVIRIHLNSPPLFRRSISRFPPADIDIHAWGNSEPKCLSNLCEVQRINVKYLLQRIRCICLQIRPEAISC